MERAFKYQARNANGVKLYGVVYAPSKALAFSKLKKSGYVPSRVEFSIQDTLNGVLNPSFNPKELARFYTTVGRRLKRGKSLVDGLESAVEYIQDNRLKQAVMMMKQGIMDGQAEHAAMMWAGFPKRDCLVIRSTAQTGKTGDTFLSLGDEITKREALRRNMASTFRMPMVMGVFMVIFIWAALAFIAPGTLAFLKQAGVKTNFSPFIVAYFKFVEIFNGQKILNTSIYFSLFYILWRGTKTEGFRKFIEKNKTMRNLALKSDQATLWNSFYLLYESTVPAKEAARIVADSARRKDSREAFMKLSRYIEGGRSLEDAVSAAGFPSFVVAGVASAASSGDFTNGLKDLVSNLEEDVELLTSMLQENAKIVSILGMGAGILLVFILTYYPMLASVMGNL